MNETNVTTDEPQLTHCEVLYREQHRAASAIGWRYAVMGIVVIALQFLAGAVLSVVAPDFYINNLGFVSLLLTLVTFDVIGFLLVFLLTRNMNKVQIEKKRMPFGHLILAILISAGFCGVGSIIGVFVHTLLTLPFGGDGSTDISMIMLNSSMWLRILVVGIGAPVIEEIIFRKFLIDRTVMFGEFFAIFLSGIFFGLFHGNFSQFFFATLLGFFFAFIYIKTGNVLYTIILHMVINMTTSVVTTVLAGKYLNAIGDGTTENVMNALTTNPLPIVMYLLWIFVLFIICFVGLIIFIVTVVKKKYKLTPVEGGCTKKKTIYVSIFNVGSLLFFAETLILFANAYVLPALQYILSLEH